MRLTTKEAYLKDLQKKLRYKYDVKEIDNIIEDYQDFFQSEMALGKSEEEVCHILGSPFEVVKALNQEMPRKPIWHRRRPAIGLIFTGGLLVLLQFIADAQIVNQTFIQLVFIFLGISLVYTYIMTKIMPASYADREDKDKKQLKYIQLSCLFIGILLFIIMRFIVTDWMVNPPSFIPVEKLGIWVSFILYGCISLFASILCIAIIKYRDCSAFNGIVFHAFGSILLGGYYLQILHSLTVVNRYLIVINFGGILYGMLLLFTCLIDFYSRRR